MQQLLQQNRSVAMTRKNFEILRELVQAQRRTVAREEPAKAVWPDTVVEEATLRQNIYTLRTLLHELDPEREYLETVPKVGHRIAVPVEPIGQTAPAPPGRNRGFPRRWVLAGLAITLLLAAAGLARWRSLGDRARATELAREASILVDSRDPDQYSAAFNLLDRGRRRMRTRHWPSIRTRATPMPSSDSS